jgi:hypothetical protein
MNNIQDYSVLYKDSVRWLFARTGILLTFGKHVHDCIISLRGEAWVDKTSRCLFKCLNHTREVS